MSKTATALDTKRTDLMLVDPKNIVIEKGFNFRGENNFGDILGLALNIVANGVLEAFIGFKVRNEDKYVTTEGHRRMRAIELAKELHAAGKPGFEDISKIERIPFRTASSDLKERLVIMATTGFGKVPLTELENAALYSKLISLEVEDGAKRGDAIKAICQRLGKSQATIYNVLKLNELPVTIKESIEKREISGSTVVTIVREVKDEAEQIRLVNEAIASTKATAGEGKASKATAKDVKGLKAKTSLQRLKEVSEKLEAKGVSNSRTKLLDQLVAALEEKQSVKEITELFL